MKSFKEFVLEESNTNSTNTDMVNDMVDDMVNEQLSTFSLPLKWDDENALIKFETEKDTDNYKVTVSTNIGTASYYVDVENDGEITKIKNPNIIASIANNFILLEKKRQNK